MNLALLTPTERVELDFLLDLGHNPYAQYANDPVRFSREVLGTDPTPDQETVLRAVRDHKVVVVMSANDVGKTYIAADAAIWFSRCLERSKVVTAAAPPLDNLQRLLWGEIDRRFLDIPGLAEGMRKRGLHFSFAPDWWCDGVAIPMAGSAAEREAKFSGKHAPYLLFIIDEGDAVPPEVYKGIESCMSGGFVRLLVMFNPRAQTGAVYDLIRQGAHVIKLDAFSHPNVITGQDKIPGAVSREITVERIDRWSRVVRDGETFSEDDPEYFAVPGLLDGCVVTLSDGTRTTPLVAGQWRKITDPQLSYMVLARFPGQAVNQLISRGWVAAAQVRWLTRREQYGDIPPNGAEPVQGLDCAEFGVDPNCSCLRYGGWVAPFELRNGIDPLEVGDWAAERARDKRARVTNVDAIGIGSGVAPAMRRWWEDLDNGCDQGLHLAVPVKVSRSPTETADERDFHRLREQLLWSVREWLRTDPAAMLPDTPGLVEELCAPQYWEADNGNIQITRKKDLRGVLGGSPNMLDALALTFAPEDGEVVIGWG